MPSTLVLAQEVEQDSLSHLQTINTQYNNERDFKTNLFYNPANMSDYSFSKFSSLHLGYDTNSKKTYRPTDGRKNTSIGLYTKSYQKLKNNVSVWGEADYSQLTVKDMQWNENLDFNRIAPYNVADSVKSKLDVEKYHFLGGYAQTFNKFSIGVEGSYTAQLAARSKDPRNKTVSSDLKAKVGANYKFYKDLEAGLYIQGQKYTQNNQVRFASLIGYAIVYQMTGFGQYNYMFSGGSSNITNIYEQFGYEYGGQITNKGGRDFYVAFRKGNQDLVKTTDGVLSSAYDISELEDEYIVIEGAKFFQKDQHRFGIKANYGYQKRLGTEYGYSNNTSVLELIYKQKSYKKEVSNYRGELFYQYNADKFSITAIPFVDYEEFDERRLRPNNGQKWNGLTFGISTDFRVELAQQNVISFQPYFAQKTVSNQNYLFDNEMNSGMKNWVLNDYRFLSSDVTSYGATLRYDLKLPKFPGLYTAINWHNNQILDQNNTFTNIQLGIIF